MTTFDEALRIVARIDDAARYARTYSHIVRDRVPTEAETTYLKAMVSLIVTACAPLDLRPCCTFSRTHAVRGDATCGGEG